MTASGHTGLMTSGEQQLRAAAVAGVDNLVPHVPDYRGACVSNILPAVLELPELGGEWLPATASQARQVVVLVIDGMGWHQLEARRELTPRMNEMSGGPIDTVAPSTTATALTSICTGVPPGEHGVVGYRIRVESETLNVLRWTTEKGDARERIVPAAFQSTDPFLGRSPTVVSRSEFAESGFTQAHLMGGTFAGYRTTASMVVEIEQSLAAGQRLTYAYYDGIDRIGHEYGHDRHFDAEYAFVDSLIAAIIDRLPADAALLVTADHGQVQTGDELRPFHSDVMGLVQAMSGEARFRWLHCAPGRSNDLVAAATEHHGEHAWIRTIDQAVDEGLFGPLVSTDARQRLGDVAVMARGVGAFIDPAEGGPGLIGRHGSVTPAEVQVPLLYAST